MGWLLGLIIVNLMSSGVIAVFEETLATTIALAFFMPLLIDSGGQFRFSGCHHDDPGPGDRGSVRRPLDTHAH